MTTELLAWFNEDLGGKDLVAADEIISQPFFQGDNTSDSSASAEETFRNSKNHVNALASILNFAGDKAGFHPSTQAISDGPKTYTTYIQKVSTFPGLTLQTNINSSKQKTNPDIDVFVKQLLKSYERFKVDETKSIASMARMANTAKSQSNLDESDTLFNQMSINGSSDGVVVTIGNVTLKMKKNVLGQKTYVNQEYSVSVVSYKLNPTYVSSNASSLAKVISKKTLDDWVSENSSATDSLTKTCFTK